MSNDEHEAPSPLLGFRVELDETNPLLALLELKTAKGITSYIVTPKRLELIATECAKAVAIFRDLA